MYFQIMENCIEINTLVFHKIQDVDNKNYKNMISS